MNRQTQIVKTLQTWIEANLHHTLSVNDVAEKSGYSIWHVQRLFRQVTHKGVGEYIRERRLINAATALLTSNASVLSVALQYGYESQHAFTRSFRNYFSQPPGSWRRSGCCTATPLFSVIDPSSG